MNQSALSRSQFNQLTPNSILWLMAYLQKEHPLILRAQRPDIKHRRAMARWIGAEVSEMHSFEYHPLTALHLLLLVAGRFLTIQHQQFTLLPRATDWLNASATDQLLQLIQPLQEPGRWEESARQLRLGNSFPVQQAGTLRNALQAQLANLPQTTQQQAASAQLVVQPKHWLLYLNDTLPSWLLFDLLQLGEWKSSRLICLTSFSIGKAVQQGYPPHHLLWLLETATHKKLEEHKVLAEWTQQATAFQLHHAHLLSVYDPKQITELFRSSRLRRFVQQQISPRQMMVDRDIAQPLAKQLAKQGIPLHVQQPADHPHDPADEVIWFGLRLLTRLKGIVPEPLPAPFQALEGVEARLTAAQISDLEARVQRTIDHLQQAISGQDAFFPAVVQPTVELINAISDATAHEQWLTIDYQGLGEPAPRRRSILPLRLEQRQHLYYLHAYCQLAKANRTFRLDRILAIHGIPVVQLNESIQHSASKQ